jgi:excisionase family DNA binding protein
MPIQKQVLETEEVSPSLSGRLLNKKEICPLLHISQPTLSTRMADGSIPYIKLGGRVLFDWDSVRAALIRKQRGAQ